MDEMNEKYQKYYSQILTGTLNDTLIKNISFQANIKLANLKLSPAKRKKLTEVNDQKEEDPVSQINNKEQTKDGGTF